jgi:hypothetical protein
VVRALAPHLVHGGGAPVSGVEKGVHLPELNPLADLTSHQMLHDDLNILI